MAEAREPAPEPARIARNRGRLREGLLLLGFLLVVVAAVLTVAIPELSKDPDEGAGKPPAAASSPR